MKISFLLSSFPKISETFILSQITGFLDMGVEVEIIAFKKADTHKVHPLVEQYNLMSKVKYLSSDNKLIRILKISSTILSHPLIAKKLLNKKNYHLVTSLRSLELMKQADELAKNQAVIAHYGPNGASVANLQSVGLLPELELITFFHGFDATAFIKKNGVQVYRQLFDQKNKILVINQIFKNILIELGAQPSHIAVHHMGVDTKAFEFHMHETSLPLKLLSVGRLVEKKGFDTTIDIVSKLTKAGIQVKLNIIGDGPLKNKLQEQIDRLKLHEQVFLCGAKDQIQVQQQMIESDFFVLMSRTSANGDKEGIPVVLMEAMATGLPVISTKHSGIPELVSDSKSGWLVEPKDSEAAFNIIKNALQNSKITQNISLKAREQIENHFSSDLLNHQLLDLCKKGDLKSGD